MIGDGLVCTIIISLCYLRYLTGVIRVKINNNYTTMVAIVTRFSGQANFLINRERFCYFYLLKTATKY